MSFESLNQLSNVLVMFNLLFLMLKWNNLKLPQLSSKKEKRKKGMKKIIMALMGVSISFNSFANENILRLVCDTTRHSKTNSLDEKFYNHSKFAVVYDTVKNQTHAIEFSGLVYAKSFTSDDSATTFKKPWASSVALFLGAENRDQSIEFTIDKITGSFSATYNRQSDKTYLYGICEASYTKNVNLF